MDNLNSFDEYRPYLFAIAYRMLGTVMDAAELRLINRQPGLFIHVDGRPFAVVVLDIRGNQIHNIYNIVNPEKLSHIPMK